MFKYFTRHLVALFATLGIALPAAATTFSIDYTDLWGTQTPNESGWGLNLIQQGDIIFATLFVYGTDRSARWYSASELSPTSAGGTTWSGNLYESTGPYFGAGTFDASTVVRPVVGQMTLNFSGPNNAVLQYTVGTVTVNKNITRFTLRGNNLSGNYMGGMTAKCTNAAGDDISIFHQLTVTQNSSQAGTPINMVVDFFNFSGTQSRCTFSGTYGATGRLNSITGNFGCTYGGQAGNNGTFTISQIEATRNGFNGVVNATDQFCTMNGFFGGVKDRLFHTP